MQPKEARHIRRPKLFLVRVWMGHNAALVILMQPKEARGG